MNNKLWHGGLTRVNFSWVCGSASGRLAMLASRFVQAFVSDPKALDRVVSHNVGFDDFLYIRESDIAVPDCFGIDHDRGAVLALVETAGFIGANGTSYSGLAEEPLELSLKVTGSVGIATATRVSVGTLVAADEDVLLELGHEIFR